MEESTEHEKKMREIANKKIKNMYCEDDKTIESCVNLGTAQKGRDVNPESIETLNEYIKANIVYHKIREAY